MKTLNKIIWTNKKITPHKKGWYITHTDDGRLSWRAWGRGAWWRQIPGGWIEWFDGEGGAMTYDWMLKSWKSMDLDFHQLPEITDEEAAQ